MCLAGDRGSQEEGSRLRCDREVGVALSSSDWRLLFRDSRSMICVWSGWSRNAREISVSAYLFLQPDNARPLLFQETLIFLSCGIVEAIANTEFFP